MNIQSRIFKKILVNWTQQYMKGTYFMITEVYSRDRWFYISKSVNMTYYINKIKVKNYMTFLIDNEKHLTKFSIHLW